FGSTPEGFDLDAWIEQSTRPRREVTIYRDWALLAEYERLVAEGEKAGDDEAMGEASNAEQIADVLSRMEASALVFTVEALTREERKTLAEAAPVKTVTGPDGKEREKVDEVALGDATVAKAIISPAITADQIGRMRVKLGDGPMSVLYKAVAELNTEGQALPEVPSSPER
ncbi:TPA: hypothetical protein OQU49_004391, partial [Shigella flexneri]|nr:hypothetical protein [Shigella flexneri]